MLFNTIPVIIHLKVFSCLCFVTILQAHRTKFKARARKVIFLGFKDGTKGYLLYDLQYHDLFLSRNVILYETSFPFKNISNPSFEHMPKSVDNYHNLESEHIPTNSSEDMPK